MAVGEAQAAAAARIVDSLLGEDAQEEPVPSPARPAPAAPTFSELPRADESTEEPAPAPAAPAAPAPVPALELAPKVPDDLLAELDEEDLDVEVERELAASRENVEEYEYASESEDEARERIRLKKRNEFLEAQLVAAKRGNWEVEALKFFPLSKHILPDIKAVSRRGFLRAARDEHNRIVPIVQSYLEQARAVVETETQAVVETAREEVADAWGKPVGDPTSATTASENAEIAVARAKARKSGDVADVFKAMFKSGR